MDLSLQDYVNDLDALGTAGTGSVWNDYFLKFDSHFQATGAIQ
jgi:hypothetical protein